MTIEQIAQVCHEANRAYCIVNDDFSQPRWSDAPEWQRNSAIAGVAYRLDNPDAGHDAMHNSWMWQKLSEGWAYGPVKDPENKLHPCMVPYEQLPEMQQKKDALFSAIVDALKSSL